LLRKEKDSAYLLLKSNGQYSIPKDLKLKFNEKLLVIQIPFSHLNSNLSLNPNHYRTHTEFFPKKTV